MINITAILTFCNILKYLYVFLGSLNPNFIEIKDGPKQDNSNIYNIMNNKMYINYLKSFSWYSTNRSIFCMMNNQIDDQFLTNVQYLKSKFIFKL